MMGDLQIRSGGVVAVDTASLCAASDRLDSLRQDLDRVAGLFRRAADQIAAVPSAETLHAESRTLFLASRSAQLADRAGSISARLRDLAAVYEAVELRAEREAARAVGDLAAVERLDRLLVRMEREEPGTGGRAAWDEWSRDAGWAADLVVQAGMLGSTVGAGFGVGGLIGLAPGAAGLAGTIRGRGLGVIPQGARLTGTADAVRVRELAVPAGRSAAPASLAEAAARIPSSEAGRVRVERYTMPDGSREFAVYIRGTTSSGHGERDAFDSKSNLELYGGQRSASYAATLAALHEAGAQRGDVVHAVGHSQGAMIASRLAVEGGYDTQTLVTLGSPVGADVGDATLSVAIRHTDDPVAALQGGGFDTPVGAQGSFIAERLVDPLPTTGDLTLGAHHLAVYEETAAMLDASPDPRMVEVREVFARLDAAASVEVAEYAATRVSASPSDAG
jgi:hypothetical protein